METLYCAVRVESLNIIQVNLSFQGRAVTRAVSLWLLTAETWVRSQASHFGIFGGHIGNGASFLPRDPVFPSLYHSTSAPYSFSSTYTHRSPSRRTCVRSLGTSHKSILFRKFVSIGEKIFSLSLRTVNCLFQVLVYR